MSSWLKQTKNSGVTLADRINRLPKWAREFIHNIETFVEVEEVQELTFLSDQNRQLIKLVAITASGT